MYDFFSFNVISSQNFIIKFKILFKYFIQVSDSFFFNLEYFFLAKYKKEKENKYLLLHLQPNLPVV